ncbi:MAG TPA: MgtC/SapB family protein [Vicinamibacterales bacterium]
MNLTDIAGLLVATLGGAAIGLEREWSGHASGPHARFGGIRTFTLLGTLGGMSGWLSMSGLLPLAVVLLAASSAIVVVGYVAASRTSIDATTEVAAIVVLAAGTLSGAGHLVPGSALVTATALLLVEKTRLHALVSQIDDQSLRASVRFAAMACVILPLLPPGPYGPYDVVKPRELWALVLFFSGLSFVGWILKRVVGPSQGVILSGLLGGIVSSTSVTLTFARESRDAKAARIPLAAGVVGACTVMVLRVALSCAVLNRSLAVALLPYLAAAFAIGAVITLIAWRRTNAPSGDVQMLDSPLRVTSALQMAALFLVVLLLTAFVKSRWGSTALVATSAIVGLTDLDALTLSLARGSMGSDIEPISVALVTGILSNTVLKLVVAGTVGRGWFRVMTAGALGAVAVALGIMLVFR